MPTPESDLLPWQFHECLHRAEQLWQALVSVAEWDDLRRQLTAAGAGFLAGPMRDGRMRVLTDTRLEGAFFVGLPTGRQVARQIVAAGGRPGGAWGIVPGAREPSRHTLIPPEGHRGRGRA